jgi:hypothetical protein
MEDWKTGYQKKGPRNDSTKSTYNIIRWGKGTKICPKHCAGLASLSCLKN